MPAESFEARLRALSAQLQASFDPGGNLPDDCAPWARAHEALLDELDALIAGLPPSPDDRQAERIKLAAVHLRTVLANTTSDRPDILRDAASLMVTAVLGITANAALIAGPPPSPDLEWYQKRCAWLNGELDKFRAVAKALTDLDWCIGYELTEANAVALDNARDLAFKALTAGGSAAGIVPVSREKAQLLEWSLIFGRLAKLAGHDDPDGISVEEAVRVIEARLTPLNERQERAVKELAADDRLWTTQETVEINLRTFARTILAGIAPTCRDCPQPATVEMALGCWYCAVCAAARRAQDP